MRLEKKSKLKKTINTLAQKVSLKIKMKGFYALKHVNFIYEIHYAKSIKLQTSKKKIFLNKIT